jgi:ribosomal protein L37AE/L43A
VNSSKKTRKQLVLEVLQRNLNVWIDGSVIMQPDCGGGRFGARIEELRKDGYEIEARAHPDPKRDIWQYRICDKAAQSGFWECSVCGTRSQEKPTQGFRTSIVETIITASCWKCKKQSTVWQFRKS